VTRIRLALAVAGLLLVAGCGSGGGGSGALPSVTRPSQPATTTDGTGGSPTTDRPADSTEAPKPTSEPEPDTTEAPEKPTSAPPATTAEDNKNDETTTKGEDATTADDEGGTTWWPWLVALLVVAAIIGVIVLVRRSHKASPWPAQTAAVLGESDAITTHLVGLPPEGLAPVASADANRLATLMASVQELVTSAPDETSRRAVAALLDPLRSLHSALDAIALTMTLPSMVVVDDLRDRARALHSATSLARATLQTGSPV
jgi:hypothetical protein